MLHHALLQPYDATSCLAATVLLLSMQGVLHKLHLRKLATQRFTILDTMNSILYPGRFTLLLGPPGAGKSTLLNALAGRLHKSSSVTTTGNILYNGKGFDQFRAVHTAAYVDQNDLHQPELTVRETFNFAARCQGTGHKAGRQVAVHSPQCVSRYGCGLGFLSGLSPLCRRFHGVCVNRSALVCKPAIITCKRLQRGSHIYEDAVTSNLSQRQQ